ncbi:MAG TPA: hypothetical protein VFN65_01175, partial [Solirubrobacteraceae bacterium]|nr:hypothetical protein [Solirubrobacteraceae bacterium]
LNLVSTYIGEMSPARLRGRISVLTFLVGIIGQAVTPLIALALIPSLHGRLEEADVLVAEMERRAEGRGARPAEPEPADVDTRTGGSPPSA